MTADSNSSIRVMVVSSLGVEDSMPNSAGYQLGLPHELRDHVRRRDSPQACWA